MLFFRSEETLQAWCDTRSARPGPVVTVTQLWGLATRWYASRLTVEARRPRPEEMRVIFAGLGLTGTFWDPQGDRFT